MQAWLDTLFRPAAPAAATGEGANFEILRPCGEDELRLAELHSALDTTLCFLQRQLGYALLDDARASAGGGVRLSTKHAGRPIPGDGQARLGPPGGCVSIPGNRLRNVGPGPPSPSTRQPNRNVTEDVDEEEGRISILNQSISQWSDEPETIKFKAETAKYAHHPFDLVLVWRFVNSLKVGGGGASSSSGGSQFPVSNGPSSEMLYKTVLLGVRLMHLCDYDYSDVVVTLAYASVYFPQTFEKIGQRMSENEAAHVCVLLIYLAHSFVLDETCPLRCWQKHVFRKYCTLKVLDAALFRIFQMRKYRLRISQEEESRALRELLRPTHGFDVQIDSQEIVRDLEKLPQNAADTNTSPPNSRRGEEPVPNGKVVESTTAASGSRPAHAATSNGVGGASAAGASGQQQTTAHAHPSGVKNGLGNAQPGQNSNHVLPTKPSAGIGATSGVPASCVANNNNQNYAPINGVSSIGPAQHVLANNCAVNITVANSAGHHAVARPLAGDRHSRGSAQVLASGRSRP